MKNSNEGVKKSGMKHAGILVLIILIAIAGINIYSQVQINNELEALLAAAAEEGSGQITSKNDGGEFTISGTLAPVATYSIKAQVSGKIASVNVEKGDSVTSGQLLIKQDDSDVKLTTGQGSSSLETIQRLRIAYDSAEEAYQKNVQLYEEGAISETVFTQSKNARDTALLQYQASSNLVSEQVAKTEITSPGEGIVSALNVKEGDSASPGAELAVVSDTSRLLLKGNADERSLSLLTEGETIEVFVDTLDKTFEGKITYAGQVAGGTGKLFPIEITIDNAEGEIKAGMSASAVI